jgi:hypothetical protein
MNTFNAIAKILQVIFGLRILFQSFFLGQIVAIHPQEDFNQIWLQAFLFLKNESNLLFF